MANVFRSYEQATKDLPPEGRRFVAEKVGVRLIEDALLEDEPKLQQIWANLLAAAVSKGKPDVKPRYISTAKELTPVEALFLKHAHTFIARSGEPIDGVTMQLPQAPAWPTQEVIEEITTHLISLGVVKRVEYKLNIRSGFDISGVDVKHLTALDDGNSRARQSRERRFSQMGARGGPS